MTDKKLKLTPWFGCYTKPSIPGVYKRKYPKGVVLFSYFNGAIFYEGRNNPNEASKLGGLIEYVCLHQNLPWRGVLKDE